jgi:hypothetical protein
MNIKLVEEGKTQLEGADHDCGIYEVPQGLKSVRENGLPELEKISFWLKSSKLAPLRGNSKLAKGQVLTEALKPVLILRPLRHATQGVPRSCLVTKHQRFV